MLTVGHCRSGHRSRWGQGLPAQLVNPAFDRSHPPRIHVKITKLQANVRFAHPVRKSICGNGQAGTIPPLPAVDEYRLGALVDRLQHTSNVDPIRLPGWDWDAYIVHAGGDIGGFVVLTEVDDRFNACAGENAQSVRRRARPAPHVAGNHREIRDARHTIINR